MDYELPRPSPALVIVTQALLGALFLVGIGVIALLPGLAADAATTLPEYADLRAPLLAIAIAFAILALLALAIVSLLVQRIYRGAVLNGSSLLWVDVLVGTIVGAAVLVIVAFVVISIGQAGNPFLALIQVVAFLALSALAYLTLVLRSLLRRAIAMSTELDVVV
ncbi:MAG: DUF2975 domain-containing protein [Salinibacterium sp.]|nr:DUF2975 domain-containing protein [Salinibacterium sp.]MBF0671452.1 DUF2975 domain-containing protein [Salinibacterium sp.]